MMPQEILSNGAAKQHELKEKILDALVRNDGLTITGISRILVIHPSTASKYLAVMEAEGSIICRTIGMAKVFKCKDSKSTLKGFVKTGGGVA